MKLGSSIAALVAGCAIAGSAYAEYDTRTLRPYINLGGQYVSVDDNARGGADDGLGAYLGVGVPINPWLGIEFNGFYDALDGKDGGSDWDELGGEVGGLITYPAGGGWVPYLGGSVGVINSKLNPGSAKSDDPFGAIGLGVFKYFDIGGKDIALRLDARYRHINLDRSKLGADDPDEAVVRLGLALPFGTPLYVEKQPEAPAPAKAIADADGDGVADINDRCPDTPKGVKVDAEGCPVDDKAAGQSIIADVYFAYNSDKLSPDAIETLNKVLATLNGKQTIKLVLKGHTDAIGTDGYNQALSERRASSVRNYLTKRGVEADRLRIEAYGETRPVADNATDEGRAKNRRVEIRTD